jgi:hypothetical protein
MSDSNNNIVLKNKDTFVEDVQKWVALDSQLKIVNEKTRIMRETKHALTQRISEYVDANQLRDRKVEISDGSLRFCEKKEYAPLTYGYIQESLNKLIPNPEHVDRIIQHLKENREVKTAPDIRRTFTKNNNA